MGGGVEPPNRPSGNAHVQLQAIEYLNISGLVIDFATSPVRTGNSFFALATPLSTWLAYVRLRWVIIASTAILVSSLFNHIWQSLYAPTGPGRAGF